MKAETKISDWTQGNWIPVAQKLPPEYALVECISPGGMQQTLKRKGRLWFLPDMSMYVYYEPKYWRAV